MKATRDGFGEGLLELAAENSEIVVLSADLSKATRTANFAKEYPERFFECGIAECNAIGIASGLSENGFYPVFSSFASFLTGKYDVIRVSAGYSNATMLLVGTHAGLAIGKDGVTQMGLEDVSLMRAIPNMKVFQPATSNQSIQMMKDIVKTAGPSYLRIGRQPIPECFTLEEDIELGKAQVIKDSEDADICFVTSGCILHDVKEAADILTSQGNKVSILNFHTIKPFDESTLEKFAKRSKVVITVEDHSVVGGLGSLVCESLSQNYPSRVLRIGLEDTFPESAPPADLYKKYGLDADGIVLKTNKFINGK